VTTMLGICQLCIPISFLTPELLLRFGLHGLPLSLLPLIFNLRLPTLPRFQLYLLTNSQLGIHRPHHSPLRCTQLLWRCKRHPPLHRDAVGTVSVTIYPVTAPLLFAVTAIPAGLPLSPLVTTYSSTALHADLLHLLASSPMILR
jgi:hypothetical protein